MRNLKLSYHVEVQATAQLMGAQYLLIAENGLVMVVSSRGLAWLDPKLCQVNEENLLLAEGYLPSDGTGHFVAIQDLPEAEAVCVATTSGDVLLYNISTAQVECVGSVESGLVDMVWSPDQEIVVLATGQKTLILMNKDFDPITEVSLDPEDFGEAKFITLGWGKKETQFQGSAGKKAAFQKQQEKLFASPLDDEKVRISWRGDGQYFVVSSVCPATGARKLRVWSREGVLQSTSEAIVGLEHPLCWKPSGSLIASTQRKPNKHDVIFFERNGLAHGEFTLPFGKDRVLVKEMFWNSDSSILALWLEDQEPSADEQATDEAEYCYIQLWTVNNYHWYLKQSLCWDKRGNRRVAAFCWDPERARKLHVLHADGTYVAFEWQWVTDVSCAGGEKDDSSVAVIDGDRLLVTPFRFLVVPPPMAAWQALLPGPAMQVAFCPQRESPSDLAVLITDGHLLIYRHGPDQADPTIFCNAVNGFRKLISTPVLAGTFRLEGTMEGRRSASDLHQLTWLGGDSFMALSTAPSSTSSILLHLVAEACRTGQEHEGSLLIRSQIEVEGFVISLTYCAKTGSVLLQLLDGRLLHYNPVDERLCPWKDGFGKPVEFSQPCIKVELASYKDEEVVLGLSEKSKLFIDNCEVISNCSSFALHDNFLMVCTHTHLLRCLEWHGSETGILDVDMPKEEVTRKLERGSRIVTAVSGDTKVVLQMPRGNLETIHPRPLVLAQIGRWLDKLMFKEAFDCTRKQRVNLNFIYDYNPKAFLDNVEMFLQQIVSVTRINLFLTELRDEDVMSTMYSFVSSASSSTSNTATCKRDIVCDQLRLAMERMDSKRYFLAILTALVKRSHPDIEAALQHVHLLREQLEQTVQSEHPEEGRHLEGKSVGAEEALKYLLFLVDVNELYEHALGTYDLQLALMVAEKSQKDPKEYLPVLNELKQMDEHYRRYTIDHHLGRHRKALVHLRNCGPGQFPMLLNLAQEKNLFQEALKFYPHDSSEYQELSKGYAEKLGEQGHLEEAGLVLARCGLWHSALEAFQSAGSWQLALSAAARLSFSSDGIARLARSLAVKLKEQRRYTNAACVLDQYAGDYEAAVVVLIEGHAWEEALRLVHKYSRLDLVETHLMPALLEACAEQLLVLQAWRVQFERHRWRLTVVREKREQVDIDSPGHIETGLSCDQYSDVESNLSSLKSHYTQSNSRISGRSSKNRRKAERKKLSLKEGSANEELALLNALSTLACDADKATDEIGSLLRMLVLFSHEGEACELQETLSDMLGFMETSVADIWSPNNLASHRPIIGPDSTANSIAAAIHAGRDRTRSHEELELCAAPKMRKNVKWKLEILESQASK
uniref:elongator complex protein 1 n=1 Tax=Myxine glutinosa TaxID=7769 RepID=UPI00358E7191